MNLIYSYQVFSSTYGNIKVDAVKKSQAKYKAYLKVKSNYDPYIRFIDFVKSVWAVKKCI